MAGEAIFYGALGLAAVVLVAGQLRTTEREASPVSLPAKVEATPSYAGNGLGSVVLERDPNGHFIADALINGARVRMLVDTGASAVVLTARDAQRAGIGAGDHDVKAVGAGGEIALRPATIQRLAIGPISADNLPALVAHQDDLPVSLLGQTFLERLSSVEIRGGRMTLR